MKTVRVMTASNFCQSVSSCSNARTTSLAEIRLNVEREIYTVVEGNDLEVCVVIADGTPAPFGFHVTGFLYSTLRQYYYVLLFVCLTRVYLSTVIVCSCHSANTFYANLF